MLGRAHLVFSAWSNQVNTTDHSSLTTNPSPSFPLHSFTQILPVLPGVVLPLGTNKISYRYAI